MDASQYKDYVLVMLFIKYISDKFAGQAFASVTVPDGASFKDMVKFKGKPDIGDLINKKIIEPIKAANDLERVADFDDGVLLGTGKEKVDRLTNLIAIFEDPALDFSKNRAEGDDILGDAYEYLMRHFATESGKSKGQFYTPAEVSRTMSQIIGVHEVEKKGDVTIYDPTCGSGSLLLRVGSEAKNKVTLYGQEKDATTTGLARMNMILHNNPTAKMVQGNTLANPFFQENGRLKTFDFVVANPPFSDKRWSNGLTLPDDAPFNRFEGFGIPPSKNGDYAYLLHIIRSLNRTGKAAVILPHGVLFRGNAESEIRYNLIKKGYLKGIVGLPANLFYGTGIPAAILLLDKENAEQRKGVFIIDAGKGFVKDGNKNRLREQDIRKIADFFNAKTELPGYSRMVPFTEIESNDYNLNIPRYIDNQETEDLQDISAHLKGGIPNVDVDGLESFWTVYPNLKKTLFKKNERKGYSSLKIQKEEIKSSIFEHPEFVGFQEEMDDLFLKWQKKSRKYLKALDKDCQPKKVVLVLAEDVLKRYNDKALIDKYGVYQHLMAYWNETMQDDCYLVSDDGWKAETYRITVENKKTKKITDKGWACDLIPKYLVVDRYFAKEQAHIDELKAQKESLVAELSELEEEHSGEGGFFTELDKVSKANVQKRLKEIKGDTTAKEEATVFKAYLNLVQKQSETNKAIKVAETALDDLLYAQYPKLTVDEIKTLVVDDKWLKTLEQNLKGEVDQISQSLTSRIKTLAERYEHSLPDMDKEVKALERKVSKHLEKMGVL